MTESLISPKTPGRDEPADSEFRFEKIMVRRAPSFQARGFEVEGLCGGINIIYGPNATGKTTLARALSTLLWPTTPALRSAELVGQLSVDGTPWRVGFEAGRVSYQRAGADVSAGPSLAPPDTRDRYYLGLSELLQTQNRAFAEFIARESAGGYDVGAAADALGYAVSKRANDRRVETARAELQAAEAAQNELLREDATLQLLERDLKKSRAALKRCELLHLLADFRLAKSQEALARQAVEGYPPALSQFRGDEPERLAALRQRVNQARAEEDELVAKLDALSAAIAQNPLTEPLPDTVLAALDTYLSELERIAQEMSTTRRKWAEEEQKTADAWRLISSGVEPSTLDDIGPRELQRLCELARRYDKVDAHLWAFKRFRGLLNTATAVDAQTLDNLRHGTQLLRGWLRTPPPDSGHEAHKKEATHVSGASRLFIACGAVATAASGAYLSLTDSAVWLILWVVAALLGRAFVELWRAQTRFEDAERAAAQRVDRREIYRQDFEKLGLAPPESWQPDAVSRCLDALEQRHAQATLGAEKAATWAHEQPSYLQIEQKKRDLRRQREQILADIGLNLDLHFGTDFIPGFTDEPAGVWWLVSHIQGWQTARRAALASNARLEALQAEFADMLQRFRRTLAPHTARDTPPAEDLAGATSQRSALEKNASAFAQNSAALHAAQRALGSARKRRTDAEQEVARLFERLGLPPDSAQTVHQLSARLPAYEADAQRLLNAEATTKAARLKLESHPDYCADLHSLASHQLSDELVDLEESAARRDEILTRMERIKTRIDAAKKSTAVEQKRAQLNAELAQLSDHLTANDRRVTGAVLAEFVRFQTRDSTRPKVFRRARELFATITHGRYRLDLDEQNGAEFRAFDTIKEVGQSLGELSSGTRLQLLLAVRVAFVEQQEAGKKLPLILDETLANSDDTRAGAIIEAIERIARQGRQIFYFTAQQDEVRKWRAFKETRKVPCKFIDLGEVTESSDINEASPSSTAIWASAESALHDPSVPQPLDLTHDAYRELLGLSGPLNPRMPVGDVHLWFISNNTVELYAALSAGISRWGALQNLHAFGGLEATGLTAAQFERFEARAKVVAAFFSAWAIGRGAPVTRRTLEASGAVSDTFIDEVSALSDRLNGEATALLGALERGEVKRFHTQKREELATYLESEGFLDTRDILSAAEIWTRVLSGVATEIASGVLTPDQVRDVLRRAAEG